MLPNFLIVGAAKSGTTALYYYLQQHPEIGFPNLKEPKFFSSKYLSFPHKGVGDQSVDKFAVRSFEEYKKLFEGLETFKAVGEASPDYLYYHEKTAPEIKRVLGDVPIIIILRNPVKRAFSAYAYLKRDSRETESFTKALTLEKERIEDNYDFIWAFKKAGLYYNQVKTFLEQFTSVKVLFQEELSEKPDEVLKEIFGFLGVDECFKVNTSIKNNQSGVPTNILAKILLSRNNSLSTRVRELLKKTIPRSVLERVSSSFLKKEELPNEAFSQLANFYREDIEKLENLLNKKLDFWKN